jgi:TetR/AcrR family transcriptional regulator
MSPMTAAGGEEQLEARPPGWWGAEAALLDDEEARRRLVAATARCLIRRGSSRIRIEEVAVEAGVSRSTVYRYFRNRGELILAVILSKIDVAMRTVIGSLPAPESAAASLLDVLANCAALITADPVSEALFAGGSRSVADAMTVTAEPVVDAIHHHMAPLMAQWQATGQLGADLDCKETIRWLMATGAVFMSPPWSGWSAEQKRAFLDRYVLRALLENA